ncbi:hypothetical protein E7681_00100 [Thalassobius vesicularis]|uniref:Uncharacterized protein n=1 Tax=Thalassobius vesicularis TaxID=1294297 RepID=A0A4S3MCJ7_9RHOB|nr:hypothetical protein [Thalassobius vesicularis]THD76282.1 hypothetical protein E7681_00100 [Thalassobius vesicularis]
MFAEFIETLVEHGKGIHAFRKCAAQARSMAGTTDNAAACFLLATVAEEFVENNERQPTTTREATAAFERFTRYVSMLENASQNGPEAFLSALNTIAKDQAKQAETA